MGCDTFDDFIDVLDRQGTTYRVFLGFQIVVAILGAVATFLVKMREKKPCFLIVVWGLALTGFLSFLMLQISVVRLNNADNPEEYEAWQKSIKAFQVLGGFFILEGLLLSKSLAFLVFVESLDCKIMFTVCARFESQTETFSLSFFM